MRNFGFLLAALAVLLTTAPVAAQSSTPRKARLGAAKSAKTQYLVLLKNSDQQADMETLSVIRAGHAAHLQQLTKEGRLTLAGRCPGPNNALGGMYILTASSFEEARQLTEADPAVQAGSLTMEIYPWEKQELKRLP